MGEQAATHISVQVIVAGIAQGIAWEFLYHGSNSLAHPGAPLGDSGSIFLKFFPFRNLHLVLAAGPNFRDLLSSQHEER